mmetsp:Transcript_125596/g.313850  ORF Transcript_125596/g.313850 Transcript_125596/m.313850 type:complete len:222 (+) Transcript_125596:463-1128(+)
MMTFPSFSSSTTMPNSGFGLLTANSAGGRPSTTGGLTLQKVHTRSPFLKVTLSWPVLRLFAAKDSPRRPGPLGPPPPPGTPPGFSGVSGRALLPPPAAAAAEPVALPSLRSRQLRTSSLETMNRRIISWSSGLMCSKPSKSNGDWMTRVFFRDRMNTLKMQRAWYHIIWTKPSSSSLLPFISTRRPIRRQPFSMTFKPPWSCRSRQSVSLHMARPPPARAA